MAKKGRRIEYAESVQDAQMPPMTSMLAVLIFNYITSYVSDLGYRSCLVLDFWMSRVRR